MTAKLTFILLTVSFFAFGQNECDKYEQEYIPIDLADAISYLECKWSEEDKNEFKNKEEQVAVSELHLGTGMSIRNNWELWKGKNSISRFFKSKGIFHPDDMSSIILTSFHRKLNRSNINLEEQIESYKEYWEAVEEENEIQKEKIRKFYKQFKAGDSVKMNFTIARKKNYAHLYNIGKDEKIDNDKICVVQGVVKRKKLFNRKGFVLIIEVTDICDYHQKVYYNNKKGHLEVGDKLHYDVSHFNISKD